MYRGERFNGYTHLAGTALALGGASVLVTMAALKADPWRIVGFSVYGVTLILLFLASTLYHSTRGRAKDVLRKLDYCAIYLMIAGTYTPFALVTLQGALGWTVLGAVWSLAIVGIVQECCLSRGRRMASLAIYVAMGWLAVPALESLFSAIGWSGMAWVVGGGLLYTGGIVFYLYDERIRHFHGVWHLFVLAGAVTHYAAIVAFIA